MLSAVNCACKGKELGYPSVKDYGRSENSRQSCTPQPRRRIWNLAHFALPTRHLAHPRITAVQGRQTATAVFTLSCVFG